MPFSSSVLFAWRSSEVSPKRHCKRFFGFVSICPRLSGSVSLSGSGFPATSHSLVLAFRQRLTLWFWLSGNVSRSVSGSPATSRSLFPSVSGFPAAPRSVSGFPATSRYLSICPRISGSVSLSLHLSLDFRQRLAVCLHLSPDFRQRLALFWWPHVQMTLIYAI